LTTLPATYVNKFYELKYRNVQLCIQISPRRNNAIFGPPKTLLEIASFRVEKGPPPKCSTDNVSYSCSLIYVLEKVAKELPSCVIFISVTTQS